MDLELWKFINTELLDAQIAKYGPSFEQDLRAFEVWNKLLCSGAEGFEMD